MKAVITKSKRAPIYIVHFSVELPLIMMGSPGMWGRNRELLGRSCDVDSQAIEMVEINAGRFSREIVNPKTLYQDYLSELFTVPGLEYIQRSGRYQIEVVPGLCFDAVAVCRKVASVVHRHLYFEAELCIEVQICENPTQPEDGSVRV